MGPLNLFHIHFKVSKFANFATLPSVEAKAAGPPSRPTAGPFGKKQVWACGKPHVRVDHKTSVFDRHISE
jgi:hypothetical protein